MTTPPDMERWQLVQDRRLDAHGEDIDSLKIWRAEVKGFLTACGLILGTALGLPAFVLGVLALTGRIG